MSARTVLVGVLLAGCGGASAPGGTSGAAGTTGAAGTSGTAGAGGAAGSSGAAGTSGGGGTGGSSAPACRTYATAYTYASSLGATSSYVCADGGTSGFDRTCATSGFTSIEHWPSRADFVDEAAAVGIMRLASITTSGTTTYEYDAAGRFATPRRASPRALRALC